MTPDHFVYIATGPAVLFAGRKVIEAGEVHAGMLMWHVDGGRSPQLRRVQGVREIMQTGSINVFTVRGAPHASRGSAVLAATEPAVLAATEPAVVSTTQRPQPLTADYPTLRCLY